MKHPADRPSTSSEAGTSAENSAAPGDSARLEYFVQGMDCASCVRKVEALIARLPGTSDVKTSFGRQTLELSLNELQTSRSTLEQSIQALGYEAHALADGVHARTPGGSSGPKVAGAKQAESSYPRPYTQLGTPDGRAQAWYGTQQGRLVLFSGVLLLLAWVFSFIRPELAYWGFVSATLLGTWPLARKAWASARLGDPFSINTLVAVAALGALFIGEAAEGAVVVFLFAVGELLEGVAAGRAREGIRALTALAPKTAFLLEDGRAREVSAADLRVGQLVQIRPGSRVPADGTIESGASSLDDSLLTGESAPVDKSVGDFVYAGSINADGVLTVRVDQAAGDNTIARIIHMVEEAESRKAPVTRFIDRFSRLYTPAVVAVAALTAFLPPLVTGDDPYGWLYRGITLLLIGCPCALVLSVPAAITSGISAGARRGLLIKGGEALETIGSVRTVAFDKTGTLTAGQPRVTDVIGLTCEDADVVRLAAAVESGSSHPLASAIIERAGSLQVPVGGEARAIAGKAVTATVEGRSLAVGSPRFAREGAPLTPEVERRIAALEAEGKTVVVLLHEQTPLGLLAIRDEPRQDAREAVARLRGLGLHVVMLTGDNARTAGAIAHDLGVDVQAELLPEDKLRWISQLKQRGKIAMVGDGINDAPALAQSDVAIAMGGGSDVALETADAALLGGRVSGVADLVCLSRATMANIRQNIAFALGLKAIFLVMTLLGVTSLWMAILADTGATVLVTANALRLLSFGRREGVALSPSAPIKTTLAR